MNRKDILIRVMMLAVWFLAFAAGWVFTLAVESSSLGLAVVAVVILLAAFVVYMQLEMVKNR